MSRAIVFVQITNRESGKPEWIALDRIVRVSECGNEEHAGFAVIGIDHGGGNYTLVEADETPASLMDRLKLALD